MFHSFVSICFSCRCLPLLFLLTIYFQIFKLFTQFTVSYLYSSNVKTWLSGKESTCNAGDPGLILGSGRSPGKGIATLSNIFA